MFRFFCCFLLLTGSASSVTLRHGLNSSLGSDLGARIDHAGVVEIRVRQQNGSEILASGVLLNENWILTAGHVAGAASADRVSVSLGTEHRTVDRVHAHDGWSADPSTGLSQAADLTLLKLSTPIADAPEVPLWEGRGLAEVQDPLIGLITGYGNGGNGLLGAYLPAGDLQAGFNVIDRFLPTANGAFWVTDFDSGQSQHNALNAATVDLRYYDVGFENPTLSEAVLPLVGAESRARFTDLPTADDYFPGAGDLFPEATTARGDSGGPLFIFNESLTRWELAGITSFGVNPLLPDGFTRFDSRYGDLSFFSDVGGQQDWLSAIMVPESPVAALLILPLLVSLKRRRGTTRARGTRS